MIFCALTTQWRLVTGLAGGGYQGLDYSSIVAVLQLQGIARRDWPDLFWRLQTLEGAALTVLNEKRS